MFLLFSIIASIILILWGWIYLKNGLNWAFLGTFAVTIIVVLWGIFWFVIQSPGYEWTQERQRFVQDVEALLSGATPSDRLTDLTAAEFISTLTYYGYLYPADGRVWKRLAIVLVQVGDHLQALKAVRRFLTLAPDDVQGLKLEVQLLSDLVESGGQISKLQLEFAIKKMLDYKNHSAESLLFFASLANQHGFESLARQYWKRLLDQDTRPDGVLSKEALQGRRILQSMLRQSLVEPPSDSSISSEANQVSEIQLELEFDAGSRESMRLAAQQGLHQAHVWFSVRSGNAGPPQAAKIIWFDLNVVDKVLPVVISMNDRIGQSIPWTLGQKVHVQAFMVLDKVQSDPVKARESEFRGEVELTVQRTPSPLSIQFNPSGS